MSLSVNVADLRGLRPAPELRRPGSGGAPGGTRRLDDRRGASSSLFRPELSREIASTTNAAPPTPLPPAPAEDAAAASKRSAMGSTSSAVADMLENAARAEEDFSLSIVQHNTAEESLLALQALLVQRLSRGTVYQGSGNIVMVRAARRRHCRRAQVTLAQA